MTPALLELVLGQQEIFPRRWLGALRGFSVGGWVPAPFCGEIVTSLNQRGLLTRGQLELGGTNVRLARISCPALLLAATADRLVSPRSALALVFSTCSRDVAAVSLEGGHESLVVGATAHRTLWPEAVQWIADHSPPRSGPDGGAGERSSGRRGLGGSGGEGST